METQDRYRWLEAAESVETRKWISRQQLSSMKLLQTHSERSMVERRAAALLAAPSMDLPFTASGRSVFTFRAQGQELPNCYWRNGANATLSLLAAAKSCKDGHRTPWIVAISRDGERAAVGWRKDCCDELDVQVVELDSGCILAERLPCFGSHKTVPDTDLRGYWYMQPAERGLQLCYQTIPSSGSFPTVVQECLPSNSVGDLSLMRFNDSPWLVLAVRKAGARCAFDYYLVSRTAGMPPRALWREWTQKAMFCATGDQLFVLTDWEAPNQCVLHLDLSKSKSPEAITLIPEGPRPFISMSLAGELLLLRVVATPWTTELKAYSLCGKPLELDGLPNDGTIEAIRAGIREPYVYLEASGVCARPAIYRLDTRTRRATPLFQVHTRAPMPPVETIKTWYQSSDGTQVPVRVSRRKDIRGDRALPAMLTTYGGFCVTETLRYTNRSALWLSMGGIYVHAGVRGGGELGAEWHREGKLDKKENGFADFIGAAEWLIENGYTTADKLAIVGGSNAGLIVAVAMTMRPDLFGAVICSGPLLDMLRYHLFAGGRIGLPEYGSPDIPEDENVLRRYSPYHNIRDGCMYPPALFISGDSDTRCDPMHARKMVARMQDANPSGHPVLLDYRHNKGHAGLMPLPDRVDTLTNQFVFLIEALGLQLTEQGEFRRTEQLLTARATAPQT